MNKTRKRSFTALLFVLASLFVLVLSLGIFSACGSDETTDIGENTGTEAGGPSWYYGDKAPAEDLGEDGDYYLNTETLASYVKEGKTWREAMSGEVGSWYYGTAAPNANLGSPNDFYLNTSTGELYQKTAGGWGTAVLVLKGEHGRDGVIWHSGDKAPEKGSEALKKAQPGDFYLDYSKFDVYQLQKSGEWVKLGSIKGEKGDAAEDPVQFYDGKGTPYTEENKEKLAGANVGDLYLGVFDGWEEGVTGSGSRLYRYNGTDWDVLMDTIKENQLEIHSYADLVKFRDSVMETDYAGKEIHLKTTIDFNEVEPASIHRAVATIAAGDWTPIGTAEHPFRGIFDGEGNTIENFSAKTTDDAQAVGFFGHVDGATIEHLHFVNATVSASGEGSVGAVVVGQATGNITVKDVTVTGNSTVTAEGNATTGSLVGKSDGTVTVEQVEVESNTEGTESGKEGSTLVGSGTVDFQGENIVEYQIADGFVEKHYKSDDATTVICEITSVDGLGAFRDSVNGELLTDGQKAPAQSYENKTVKLMTKIDLNNESWTPIGTTEHPFRGTFDGNGKTVSNLKIVAGRNPLDLNKNQSSLITDKDAGVGFFGHIAGKEGHPSVIKDFTLENVDIEAPLVYAVGAAVGDGGTHNSIEGITVTGKIKIRGYQWVGGITGHALANIKNCKVESTADIADTASGIFANHQLGGIVGNLAGGFELSGNTVKNIRLYAEDTVLGDKEGTGWEGHGGVSAKGVAGGIGGILADDGGAPAVKNNVLENVVIDVTEVDEGYYTSTSSDPQYHGQGFDNIVLYPGLTGALVGNGCGTYRDNQGNVSIINPYNVPLALRYWRYADGGLVGGIRSSASAGEMNSYVGIDNNIRVLWDGILLKQDGWHIENLEMLEAFRDMVNGGEVKSSFNNGTSVKADYKYLWMNHDFAGENVYLDAEKIDLGDKNWSPIGDKYVMANARTTRGSSYTYQNERSSYSGPKRFESDIVFKGTFNGQNHTISNLTIDTDDGSQYKWGFFSLLKGNVKDVVFENVDIFAQNALGVGAVAAQCENAKITNVKVQIKDTGSIEGYQWVGGLVGYATSLTASGNEVSGSIKFTNYKAGGLVGLILGQGNALENNTLHDLTISTTTGFDYMGGLIGGTSGANGGVRMKGNTFENVTLDGSKAPYTGVKDEINSGDIGALMGNVGDGPYYSQNNSGTVTVLAQAHTKIHHKGLWGRDPANLDNSSNPELTVVWNGIEVTEKAYALDSAEDLALFRDWVNGGMTFEGETVILTDDINLNNDPWTPIGNDTTQFKGVFDGAKSETENYTISNLYIDLPEQNFVGLFNYIATKGAEIKNFTLHNVNVKGQTNVGAVVGGNEARYGGDGDPREIISNVTVSGNIQIEGNTRVGGITGGANTKIKDCKVIGEAGSYIKGVYHTEKMTANPDANLEGDNIGGIIGFTGESGNRYLDFVSGCYVSGVTISGTRKVGGIVAYLSGGHGVQDSKFENGTVECIASEDYIKGNTGKLFVGGIVGEVAGGTNKNQISGNTVANATISLVEVHTYDNIDPAILGGSRNGIGATLTYEGNTVGENVKINFVAFTEDDFAAVIEAVTAGTLNITLGDQITYEKRTSGGSGDQFYTIHSNAIIDLNKQTLSFTDTNDYGSACALRVGASVTSLEFKNGHVTYVKKEHDDGTFAKDCTFLNWTASGTAACDLTFDNVQLDGYALLAQGISRAYPLTVVIKNHSKLVGTKAPTIELNEYVTFTATDSELGKMLAYTANGSTSISLTGCIFAGTDINENRTCGFYGSTIFKAEDTMITGDIQFSGHFGEIDGVQIDDATIKGGSIGGKLVIGGDEWNPTKVTLDGTQCTKDQIELLDKKSTLTIDGEPYVAE